MSRRAAPPTAMSQSPGVVRAPRRRASCRGSAPTDIASRTCIGSSMQTAKSTPRGSRQDPGSPPTRQKSSSCSRAKGSGSREVGPTRRNAGVRRTRTSDEPQDGIRHGPCPDRRQAARPFATTGQHSLAPRRRPIYNPTRLHSTLGMRFPAGLMASSGNSGTPTMPHSPGFQGTSPIPYPSWALPPSMPGGGGPEEEAVRLPRLSDPRPSELHERPPHVPEVRQGPLRPNGRSSRRSPSPPRSTRVLHGRRRPGRRRSGRIPSERTSRRAHSKRAHSCTRVRIQARYSSDVGRKSRAKRVRHTADADARSPVGAAEDEVVSRGSAAVVADAAPRGRPARLGQDGARVARVAVDDDTWAAFRRLCGDMPASVRLGQLVEADVQRAREVTPESEAVAAVRAIRAHADQLEAFIRDSG